LDREFFMITNQARQSLITVLFLILKTQHTCLGTKILFILIFFVLDRFDVLISKINFKK
jgi:hypothetical protein